ncbi:ubiquinone biosynthesis accessory factor UbiJ [Bordetella sp. 2513F-2]
MLPLPILPQPPRLLAKALNALLAREAWARERLARHAGKTARLAAGALGVSLTIDSEGMLSPADPAIVPDVTLTLAAGKLQPALLLSRERPDFAGLTHISGDAALAQLVAELARDLRWDAEDDLARVVGDIPAARLASGARLLGEGLRTAGGRLAANVAEYLSEEQPLVLGRPAFEQWRQDLAGLQAALDDLDRRAAQLGARLPARRSA